MSDILDAADRPSRPNEIRAVRVMVDELRAQPVPEMAWDALEQRLLARIAERSAVTMIRRAPPPPPSAFGRVFGFAVAAAAIAFGVATTSSSGKLATADTTRHAVDVAATPWSPTSSGAHDLASLHPGDAVEAGTSPVSFGQAGLVRWTLSAGSALRVRTVGVGHTVELERGSIRAEVTPRDPSEGMIEAFAVEVGGTRVAVHGTAFSVQIVDGQVVVDVEHGAVAVGPVGNAGTTTGHLLVGPSRGVFSLDGGRTARLLDRPAMETPAVAAASQAPDQVADRVVVAAAPADADRAAEAPASDAVAAAKREIARAHGGDHADHADHVDRVDHVGGGAGGAKPAGDAKPAVDAPAEPPRLTTATVRARIDRCFRSAFNADPSSTLKAVSSTLSIDVNADGTVRAAKVDPPLTAELTGCVGSALSGRFADDAGHVDIPLSFQR